MQSFNEKLAKIITDKVGTMYCAYLFGLIGVTGVTAAITNNAQVVLIVGAISGYFLQLVLLPVIMVGQNLQQKKTAAKIDDHHAAIVKHIDKHHEKIKALVQKKS